MPLEYQKERRKRMGLKIFQKHMAEKSPNLANQQTKNHCVTCKYKLSELKTGLNPEISTPVHIRVKLMKSTGQKKKILNASREK